MGKEPKSKSPHPFRDGVEMMVFAISMALGLKVFALEAYQIPTGSMMPTMMGTDLVDPLTRMPNGGIHDRVLVDKVSWWLREPNRWEVVVFRYPLLAHQNYVKRLVGMPDEELLIQNGDIWTRAGEGEEFTIEAKPEDLQKTLWKRVLPTPSSAGIAWSGWDTTGQIPDSDGNLVLAPRRPVRTAAVIKDEYRHGFPDAIADRIPVSGAGALRRNVVSDLRINLQVIPEKAGSPLRLKLNAGPYPVELILEAGAIFPIQLALPDGRSITSNIPLVVGATTEVELAFWDHHVLARVNGWEWSELLNLEAENIIANEISLIAPQGRWLVQEPLVFRDIYYLPPMRGAAPLFKIPAGHYFMMGDNTQNSHDGRDWESRELVLQPPVDGRTNLRGDNFRNGSDPQFDNPRWSLDKKTMAFRNQYGEVFEIPKESIIQDHRVPASFVPRNHLMGRALVVFMPFWPILRMGVIR